MLKVEHIGIAVKNLQESNKLFKALLGSDSYKTEEVKEEGVLVSFFKTGESKIELLQALDENSPISKFITKKGEGVHHLAFEVKDIVQSMAEMKKMGFEL